MFKFISIVASIISIIRNIVSLFETYTLSRRERNKVKEKESQASILKDSWFYLIGKNFYDFTL